MAFVVADRVKETSTSTGTGTITLAGAVTGFQSFAAVGNGNTTYYCIASQSANEWEVGLGTYTSSGTTLARTTVLSSSNGGSLVNFSAGTKDVFVTYPAGYSVYSDGTRASGTWAINISGTANRVTGGNLNPASTSFNNAIASASGSNRVVTFDGNGNIPSVWWSNGSTAVGAVDGNSGGGLQFWANNGSSWQQQATATYGSFNVLTSFQAPIFYDYNDTGYYLDPNSTSNSALRIRGGALHGPNPTWGAYLYVGTDGTPGTSYASVCTTNGNLHLDAVDGYAIYLNNYSTNSYTIASQSIRSPIFYDLNNTGYYVDPASTSNLNGLTVASTISGSINGNAATASNAALLNSISAVNLFNNMGDVHGTRTSFDAQGATSTVNFGWRYVQGSTNGPGTNSASQYYSAFVGLGSNYAYNTYGMQIAIPRNVTSPYLSVRYEEGGAFGAWTKISAGYADSAGSASSASSATSASYLTGGDSAFYGLLYNALSGDLNTYNNPGLISAEYTGSTNRPTASNGHYIQISDAGGTDVKTQWYFPSSGVTPYMRLMWGNANWLSWQALLTSGNYSGYSNFSGAVYGTIFYDTNNTAYYADPASTSNFNALNVGGYGVLTYAGATTWNVFYFGSNKGAGSYLGSNNTYGLEAYSSDGGAAAMSFHRGGYYAVNMGLDPDNVMRIGGWSASANLWQLDMSGNEYLSGSSRAPIFYDSNNTAYYADPAGTSNLNGLNVGGAAVITTSNISSYAATSAASGAMLLNTQTISANYTLSGNNAVSAGPITINTGVTVTISTGCNWSIV